MDMRDIINKLNEVMQYQYLVEYITYDNNKFMTKYQSEGKPFENQIGANGENFTDWLEQYDPTNGNKYVNWMIIRYLKNDIKRLEDIPSRISPALKKYMGLQNKKKLKPEHKDLNKIRNLEDVIDEYQDEDVTSKSEKKDKYLTSGDAELVYEDESYRIIVPKTEEASCYFGVNTRWCTAAKEGNMFDHYHDQGPLYIILHKPSNTRWQFQFETEQYMDEKDEEINIVSFFREHKKVFGIFKKLGYVDYNKESWKLGDSYYNDNMEYHREDGPAVIYSNGTKHWYLNGERHREDGPAYIGATGYHAWYLHGKLHREDGPAIMHSDGGKEWYQNNNRHREDGPAFIDTNGNQQWWVNGKLHREDGPARIDADGYQAWYVNGKYINDEVTQWAKNNNIDLDNLSSSEQENLTKFIRSLA